MPASTLTTTKIDTTGSVTTDLSQSRTITNAPSEAMTAP